MNIISLDQKRIEKEREEVLKQVKELTEYSDKVDARVQALDHMEEMLLQMKELAERVANEELKEEEIEQINQQVQKLVEEVERLDAKSAE